jgi:hypothetical protein
MTTTERAQSLARQLLHVKQIDKKDDCNQHENADHFRRHMCKF